MRTVRQARSRDCGRLQVARLDLIHLGSDAEDEEYVPRGPVSYY
jgi:hypothetical protein